MKFCEAMDALQKGNKVTRQSWVGAIYFKMDGNDVKTYQPRAAIYTYTEDIMISDGWSVEGEEGQQFEFCDIIKYLQQGKKAWLQDWPEKEMYIHYDQSSQAIVLNSMETYAFIPAFDAFVAQDWVTL